MSSFAVIKTGGKQYIIREGDRIRIERLAPTNPEPRRGSGVEGLPAVSGSVTFSEVLLIADGDTVKVGTPAVSGAHVEGIVLRDFRDDKKIVFRYHSKTRYRKMKTHRQPMTEVKITKI